MPRMMRVEYPGAIYHVIDRGDRRENIFVTDVDRHDFLKTLAEACHKTGWQVHAWCLMNNHFHLILETPGANLVEGMRWLLSSYTIRLNHRHQLSGHVFSGRYKALLVDGGAGGYLRTACDYVHLNPARASLLAREERLLAYPWSSYGWYLAAPKHRPAWLRVDRLLGEHGIAKDSAAGRAQFERRMEARRREKEDAEAVKIFERGWCLGSSAFKEQMLERMEEQLGENHSGALHRESREQQAGRMVRQELKRLGWKEAELSKRPKNDPDKLALAARVRRETTMPIRWIAQRVQIGTEKGARTTLHKWMQKEHLPK